MGREDLVYAVLQMEVAGVSFLQHWRYHLYLTLCLCLCLKTQSARTFYL
jgi:hypothetical protein